jgi:hypothetical protein
MISKIKQLKGIIINIKKIISALLFSCVLAFTACGDSSTSQDDSMNMSNATGSLVMMNFYARATQDSMSVAYGMIMNKTNSEVSISDVKITDGVEGMAEIHQTTIKDGIASMNKINEIIIPAKGSITLEPGGLHIMLMKLQGPLIVGDELKLSLFDTSNQEYPVAVSIEKIVMDMDHSKH